MSADTVAVAMVLAMAPAVTAYPLIYGLTAPWWRSLLGRALMTKAVGLALLIDISLLYHWLGDDYFLRDIVRLSVYGFILVGVWLQLSALLVERSRVRRHRDTPE